MQYKVGRVAAVAALVALTGVSCGGDDTEVALSGTDSAASSPAGSTSTDAEAVVAPSSAPVSTAPATTTLSPATSSTAPPTTAAAVTTDSPESGFITHLPVLFGPYDPATGRAGDFDFNAGVPFANQIILDFGYVIPANSIGPEKRNPQPTFHLPLGTKVRSIVDGTVVAVPTLYSNDVSIMVQADGSPLIFELEHVINPIVAEGDRVKAGDVVAEVSDYDTRNTPGLGLVEIGVLEGGNQGPPHHLCPTDYFHDSVRDDLIAQIEALRAAWEQHLGDPSIYDEASFAVAGCYTRDKIEG